MRAPRELAHNMSMSDGEMMWAAVVTMMDSLKTPTIGIEYD